jgi:hypothetical protein
MSMPDDTPQTDPVASDLERVEKEIYNKGINDAVEVVQSRIDNFQSMSLGIGPNAQAAGRLKSEHEATLGLIKALIKS